jgi:hypothetical protein
MWPQEASNTVADTVKERTLMDEHRDGDNRLADGRYKNFRNQALGTTQNRFFLQPRCRTIWMFALRPRLLTDLR